MASSTENPLMFGVWKAYKSENMGALMEKAGAPWIARKMGANATPTMVVTRLDDKHISVSTKSMMFTMDQVYELNNTVEGTMPMSKEKLAFYLEWSDGRLVCYQGPLGSDARSSGVKFIRSLEPNGDMLVTAIHGNVTAYRWFRKESEEA